MVLVIRGVIKLFFQQRNHNETSIFFNIVLSKLVLAKVFTVWHISAAVFCLASAFSISFISLFTDQEEMKGADFKVGITTALFAAFLLGVMNTWIQCSQPLI